MVNFRSTILPGLILIVLCACLPAQNFPPTVTVSSSPEIVTQPIPASTLTKLPLASQTPAPSITPAIHLPEYALNSFPYQRYFIKVDLRYLEHSAAVEQTVSFTNYTERDLTEIPLVVPAQRIPDTFHLKALAWSDGSPISGYQLRQGLLTLSLPESLGPGETILFFIRFALDIPALESAFGFTEDQILMDNWYPFIPPFSENDGWLINEPSEFGEYLAYPLSRFEVMVMVDDPEALIAAPGQVSEIKDGIYYVLPKARRFAFAISPEFVQLIYSDERFSVEFFGFGEHQIYARQVQQSCLDSLNLFSSLFGEPLTTRLVVVGSQIFDGLEADGLFFLGEEYFEYPLNQPEDWLTIINAHETSHLWWYGKVGNDPALHPWLDEAIATYSELLYLEHYYPDSVDWWWAFRLGIYEENNKLSMPVYESLDRWDYINSVYLAGVMFFDALRTEIGDYAFFGFLKSIAEQNQEELLTPTLFFETLSEHSDQDLTPIIEKYFPDFNYSTP